MANKIALFFTAQATVRGTNLIESLYLLKVNINCMSAQYPGMCDLWIKKGVAHIYKKTRVNTSSINLLFFPFLVAGALTFDFFRVFGVGVGFLITPLMLKPPITIDTMVSILR